MVAMMMTVLSTLEVCRFVLVLAKQTTVRSMIRLDGALGIMIRWKIGPGATVSRRKFVHRRTRISALTVAATLEQDRRYSSMTRTVPERQPTTLSLWRAAWRGFACGSNVEAPVSLRPAMVTVRLLEKGQILLTSESDEKEIFGGVCLA